MNRLLFIVIAGASAGLTAAALSFPSPLVYQLCFSILAFAFMCTWLLAVIHIRRPFFAAFTIFGVGYLAIATLPWTRGVLLTETWLYSFASVDSQQSDPSGWTSYPVLDALVYSASHESARSASFVAIGHCSIALWLAAIAGVVSAALYRHCPARQD